MDYLPINYMDYLPINYSFIGLVKLQDPLEFVILRWVFAGTGVIANSIVIFVFLYNKTYKKSMSLKLLLHQTVIDLFGSLAFLIFYNTAVPNGLGGTIFCKMQSLFHYASTTSTYNFILLTVERYIAVVHPLLYRQKSLGGKMTYISLISPHLCGVIITLCIPIYADIHEYVNECTLDRINSVGAILLTIFQWLIPLIIMLYCYVQMLLKLHKTRMVNQQPKSNSQPNNSRQVDIKSNLLITLFLIAFIYIVTMTPNAVFSLIYFISQRYHYTLHEVSLLMLDLNLSINPFIYCIAYKDFQNGLRKIRDDIF